MLIKTWSRIVRKVQSRYMHIKDEIFPHHFLIPKHIKHKQMVQTKATFLLKVTFFTSGITGYFVLRQTG